jgi:hypothetical protein
MDEGRSEAEPREYRETFGLLVELSILDAELYREEMKEFCDGGLSTIGFNRAKTK